MSEQHPARERVKMMSGSSVSVTVTEHLAHDMDPY